MKHVKADDLKWLDELVGIGIPRDRFEELARCALWEQFEMLGLAYGLVQARQIQPLAGRAIGDATEFRRLRDRIGAELQQAEEHYLLPKAIRRDVVRAFDKEIAIREEIAQAAADEAQKWTEYHMHYGKRVIPGKAIRPSLIHLIVEVGAFLEGMKPLRLATGLRTGERSSLHARTLSPFELIRRMFDCLGIRQLDAPTRDGKSWTVAVDKRDGRTKAYSKQAIANFYKKWKKRVSDLPPALFESPAEHRAQ